MMRLQRAQYLRVPLQFGRRKFSGACFITDLRQLVSVQDSAAITSELKKYGSQHKMKEKAVETLASKICAKHRDFRFGYQILQCLQDSKSGTGTTAHENNILHSGLITLICEGIDIGDCLDEAVDAHKKLRSIERKLDIHTQEKLMKKLLDEFRLDEYLQVMEEYPVFSWTVTHAAEPLIMSGNLKILATMVKRYTATADMRSHTCAWDLNAIVLSIVFAFLRRIKGSKCCSDEEEQSLKEIYAHLLAHFEVVEQGESRSSEMNECSFALTALSDLLKPFDERQGGPNYMFNEMLFTSSMGTATVCVDRLH